ncbi:MAG: hybrid sensor histidine kinase/response regulator [Candidatus Riflebacteria bacterium]|nr:hybrid sensor histidine kinase/response regulator [Candidatus Riflebacteria bacterium]
MDVVKSNKMPNVMLIDDTPENLSLLELILRGEYEVCAFPDGAIALEAADKFPPDIVLLDINMPGMNGYEVCRKFKENPKLNHIPILFLSALASTENKLEAFREGGVDYITKPFQAHEVLARVRTHLKIHILQSELTQKNLELSTAYASLRELEALRDTLVNSVIHDMRGPLQNISGFIDIVLESLRDDNFFQTAPELLRKVQSETEMLVEMASAVLDVSKIEANRMQLSLTQCNLSELLLNVVDKMKHSKKERKITAVVPEKAVTVRCDRDIITRVLYNLIINAMKFTSNDNGEVRTSVTSSDRGIMVSVQDNGAGIRAEHLEKIFDKFWQGEANKHAYRYSSGMGLTFCKMAVEAHGGKIGVESQFGHGSSFWFLLPDK